MNLMSSQTIKVFESTHYFSVKGVVKEITLEQLKKDGFIKSVEKNTAKCVVFGEVINNKRCDHNTVTRTGNILDIDGAKEDIFDELVDYFTKLKLKVLIHTTHSHDPDNNIFKYRVVILLDQPLPAADYHGFYDYFINIHPKLKEWNDKEWIDKHGRTISQTFLLPSCHPDRESTARMHLTDGEPYQISQYEDYVLKEEKVKPKKNGLNGHAKDVKQYNNDVVTISPNKAIPDTKENRGLLDDILKAIPSTMDYGEWRNILWSLRDFGWHDIKEIAYAWCKASNGYDEKTDYLFEKIWNSIATANRITYKYIISKYKWNYPTAATPQEFVNEQETILVFIQQHFALLIKGEVSLLQKSQLAQKDLLKIKPITKKADHKIVVKAKVNDYRSENNLKAIDPKKIEAAIETFYTDPNTDKFSHFVCSPPRS